MPLSQGVNDLHSGGFIKAFERESFSNDSDLVRLCIDNRPLAIPVVPVQRMRKRKKFPLP